MAHYTLIRGIRRDVTIAGDFGGGVLYLRSRRRRCRRDADVCWAGDSLASVRGAALVTSRDVEVEGRDKSCSLQPARRPASATKRGLAPSDGLAVPPEVAARVVRDALLTQSMLKASDAVKPTSEACIACPGLEPRSMSTPGIVSNKMTVGMGCYWQSIVNACYRPTPVSIFTGILSVSTLE